ncbi:MAG TPA: hypothetical protein VHU90_09080, partial [Galbitalea sp.]|nr:hypothetical protein [Galbitalea sp.]
DGAETTGVLMRIPEISVGNVTFRQVGVLGAGAGRGFPGNLPLFDWYSTKNAGPVVGWIGGNVLQAFCLTIDYRHRTLYFLRQREPEQTDLNQVGLTLQRQAREYVVSGIASKQAVRTVAGVEPGDTLVRIDKLDATGATLGQIYGALHGQPGETRTLIVRRGTELRTVRAIVTSF